MLNFARTFFGVIFFGFIFGLLLIKNSPKFYEVGIEAATPFPQISYIDLLRAEAKKGAQSNSSFENNKIASLKIKKEYSSDFQKNTDELRFILPTDQNFTITEAWTFSPDRKKVQLAYQYSLDFEGQLFLLRNPSFHDSLRTVIIKRITSLSDRVAQKFNQHHYIYKGETTLPLQYYLALEGNSPWTAIEKETTMALETLNDFAATKNIPLEPKSFIVYPQLNDSIVRWRAGIQVSRYYNTGRKDIRCRRYRGGQALVLVHQGPLNYLKKSWEILQDSLSGKTQAYPGIQLVNKNKASNQNPLTRTTTLYLPIQQ